MFNNVLEKIIINIFYFALNPNSFNLSQYFTHSLNLYKSYNLTSCKFRRNSPLTIAWRVLLYS